MSEITSQRVPGDLASSRNRGEHEPNCGRHDVRSGRGVVVNLGGGAGDGRNFAEVDNCSAKADPLCIHGRLPNHINRFANYSHRL